MVIRHDDPECRGVAAELLRRHGGVEAEANITSQIREFLVRTGLVESSDIREEISPAEGSGNSVDLAALDTLIEVKRRIGNGVCQINDGRDRNDGTFERTSLRRPRVRAIMNRFHGRSRMDE